MACFTSRGSGCPPASPARLDDSSSPSSWTRQESICACICTIFLMCSIEDRISSTSAFCNNTRGNQLHCNTHVAHSLSFCAIFFYRGMISETLYLHAREDKDRREVRRRDACLLSRFLGRYRAEGTARQHRVGKRGCRLWRLPSRLASWSVLTTTRATTASSRLRQCTYN